MPLRHLVLLALSLLPLAAAARGYTPTGSCAGFPRLPLKTPPGFCVALVADEREGLRMPRRVLEVAPDRFWIVDMGSWEPKRGRLIEMTLRGAGQRPAVRTLASDLDRPLGLARGPDGRVYIGSAGTVWRTPVPPPGQPIKPESVLTGLPADGAHPLKEIAFGENGRLYVNLGSTTDACRDDRQQQPDPCPDREAERPRGAVYEAEFGGPGFTLREFRPYAVGLRNSVALAVVPKLGLLQAENSVDYRDVRFPPEELNLLRDGSDHGWPYCIGDRRPARGYDGHDCRRTARPIALWPAHAAPLGLLWVSHGPLAGTLLASWHGPRVSGHRVVGVTFDAKGRPSAPVDWIGGWTEHPGVRPLGTPTGLALDHRGRVWIAEDRNRSLLMLVRDDAGPRQSRPAAPSPP